MPSPDQVKALVDAGFAVLFVTMVVVLGVGAIRGWIVPGWIYDDERRQRGVAETQAERTVRALEKQTAALVALTRDMALLRADVERLRSELGSGRGQPVSRD